MVLELLKCAVGRSDYTVPSLGLCLLERANALSAGRNAALIELGEALRAEIEGAVGDGVLLYAPHARVAPRHAVPLLLPLGWVYTAIFNVLQLPVTQVPLGLDSRGLPLGVQVGARHGADHRTIAVARALEEAFGGWVKPPL